MANAGADIKVSKRHGGWKTITVAEKYVKNYNERKTKISRMIQWDETYLRVLQQKSADVDDQ